MGRMGGMTAGTTALDLFKGRHFDREIIVLGQTGRLGKKGPLSKFGLLTG
jgi:hypothetical protein